METNQVKQFCAIVETGNLRKAAELMGISHSGLSKSMKVFQRELGRRLYVSRGRGLVITDYGRELYRRSAAFFAEVDTLLGHTPTPAPNVVRIGSFEVFTTFFIGHLAKNHLQGTDVDIHELIPGRLEEALTLNRVDFGITYEPVPRQGISYEKVTRIKMGVFAKRGAFVGEPLERVPFVVPINPLEGAPSGVRGLDAWPEQRFERFVRFRVDLMTTGLSFVSQGLCAIFIPEFVAYLHNLEAQSSHHLEKLEIPRVSVSVSRDVYLVHRESRPEDLLARKIHRAIRELCHPERS